MVPSQGLEDLSSDQNIHEILKLLNESTDCQTTIPHDRIYALIGMAGIGPTHEQASLIHDNLAINVDYNVSLESLYRRLAMSIMLYAGAYSILATDGTFHPREGFGFPSWTPDFRYRTRCKLLETYRLEPATLHALEYRVWNESPIRRLRHLNPDVTSSTLCLEGVRFAERTQFHV